jgi:hypothetical protein
MNKQNGLLAAAVALTLSTPVLATEVDISGLVEVDVAAVEGYDGVTSSDIVLATAAMVVDAKLNDRVSATVVFLYEEDVTPLGVDEGYVTLQMNNVTSLVAGRVYVPFGSYESNMVSYPLTLLLGETSESAVMLDIKSGNVSGSLYTFNGDADVTSTSLNDDALAYGAKVAYESDNLTLGASYISNIADSNRLEDPNLSKTLKAEVPGVGVNVAWSMNNFSVIAEYVGATQSFANGDVLGTQDGTPVTVMNEETPAASSLELAYEMEGTTIAVGYQTSDEAQFLGLPKAVTLATVSFEVMEGASLAFEYANAEDYDVVDGGSGNTANTFTAHLAVEF